MKPLTEKQQRELLLRIDAASKRGKGMRLSADETSQLAWFFSNQIGDAYDQRVERAAHTRLRG